MGEEVRNGRIVAVAGIFVGASAEGVGDIEVGILGMDVLVRVSMATGEGWVGAATVGVSEAGMGVGGGVELVIAVGVKVGLMKLN